MKSLARDVRQGWWEILAESADDLWVLSHIILPGDLVRAVTTRKIVKGEGEPIRKTVVMAVDVEKVALEGGCLRVLGAVREGPEDVPRGDHHSLLIHSGDKLTITKREWAQDQLLRIREACVAKPPSVLVVVFDRDEATFAALRQAGHEILAHMEGTVQKKRSEERVKGDFFEDIAKNLAAYDERLKPATLLLASPAFWKDELLKRLPKDLRKKVVMASCSGGNPASVDEVLKRDDISSTLGMQRVVQESQIVEQLLAGIAKGGAVVYGIKEVEDAAAAGAVATLLVTESRLARAREEGDFSRFDDILKSVDVSKGVIMILGKEVGKRIDGLGGIAALLRFRFAT